MSCGREWAQVLDYGASGNYPPQSVLPNPAPDQTGLSFRDRGFITPDRADTQPHPCSSTKCEWLESSKRGLQVGTKPETQYASHRMASYQASGFCLTSVLVCRLRTNKAFRKVDHWAHSKLAASSVDPEPLYRAVFGYAHNGLVRPARTATI